MNPTFSTFIKLGSNRELAKLELSVLCEKLSLNKVSFHEWKDYILLNLDESKKHQLIRLLDSTGSLVKVGFISFESKITSEEKWEEPLQKLLEKNIQKFLRKFSRQIKISIGIQSSSKEITSKIHNLTRKKISSYFEEKDIQAKIIYQKDPTFEITPYQFYKENLAKRGFEITILAIKSRIYFGATHWVTNPLKDIKRDEKRKVRFFTHGTSIKLARTMVFLSKNSPGNVILDPFCGTGTILIEGLRQKMQVIGIDNDAKCFRASKENLNQFSMSFPSKEKMKDKWVVFKRDSRDLESIQTKDIDAIVTEPYLGPFLKNLPDIDVAEKTMKNLERVYIKVLQAGSRKLKQNGQIVFIIPEYCYSTELIISPDLTTIAQKSKLRIEKVSQFFHVDLPLSIGRKHNIIDRKLVIFSKELE